MPPTRSIALCGARRCDTSIPPRHCLLHRDSARTALTTLAGGRRGKPRRRQEGGWLLGRSWLWYEHYRLSGDP